MDTKLKGDVAEQATVLQALRRGWGVLRPVGDRHPYDMVFDVGGTFVRVQVKHAWADKKSGNFLIDTRRTKTNRRIMKRDRYRSGDFDFAIAYIREPECFYVFPQDLFRSFASVIHMVERKTRQRKPQSVAYREAWELIESWAAHGESRAATSVKFGEA